MNPIVDFKEFLKKGIVKKQAPDRLRADDLIKESERKSKSLATILNKIGLNSDNANDIIEYCYDIVIGLIRAEMLLNGFHSSGTGAHEAEVSYLKELGLSEAEIQFANQLRYFRNGIKYYGKRFDAEYAKKTLSFLEKMKKRLK